MCLDLLLCSLPCLASPCLPSSLPACATYMYAMSCHACCIVHVIDVINHLSRLPRLAPTTTRTDTTSTNITLRLVCGIPCTLHQLQHRPGGKSSIERCNGLRTCPAPSTQPQRPSTTEFLHTTTDSKLKTKNTNTTT